VIQYPRFVIEKQRHRSEWSGEDTMSERDETISAFAALSPDAVVVEDSTGTVVEFNAAAEALFGYPRAEVIGWPMAELVWAEPWPDSAIPGRERLFRRKDGRTFIGDVSLGKANSDGGTCVIYSVRDVTPQKAIEAQLREMCRASSEGIALAAHELRAPLNAIVGFCQLLSDKEFAFDPERQDEVLGCMLVSGRHLLRLVNDILGAARGRAMASSQREAGRDDFDGPAVPGAVPARLPTVS
jgi:PAS domain S-box-containing protein